MIFLGRIIDPVSLWQDYVDFPEGMDLASEFSPLVRCPNPSHDTHKSHFQVNLKKPLVHCFANCGISGTYERAIAIILGLTTKEGEWDVRAARKVILRSSRLPLTGEVEPPRRRTTAKGTRKTADGDDLTEDLARYLRGDFSYLGKTAIAYCDARGVDQASRGSWGIGYDEEAERLVVPARDDKGTLRFLIRRAIKAHQRPKYLYTRGFPKTSILFGACNLDHAEVRSSGLILVEGSLDVIRLHQMGYRTAVGVLGTGLSTKQRAVIDRLRPRRIYLMFDKDGSGVANIYVAHERLAKYPLRVCRYPSTKNDPAELTRKEVERSVERAVPLAQFFRKTGVHPRHHERRRHVGKVFHD